MQKVLVIVESPAKAKTIAGYLGAGHKVKASLGHILDIPKKPQKTRWGVDVDNDFEPEYETIPGKQKTISEMKAAAKEADLVYLASDPDREGEAIASHLAKVLRVPKSKLHRVEFHAITEQDIKDAMKHPRQIDNNLVEAQEARRVLDRLFGYQVSPVLWRLFPGVTGLSAGRVQSCALGILVEREKEIRDFKPRPYWLLGIDVVTKDGKKFRMQPMGKDGKALQFASLKEAEQAADAIDAAFGTKGLPIISVEKEKRAKHPQAPFTTSTLQQDAANQLGFSAKDTMTLAQELYEGVDMGKGRMGVITYMRTDSTRISDKGQHLAEAYIKKAYPGEYQARTFKNKDSAQDAHEAIRPSDTSITPAMLKGKIPENLWKLYDLIFRRFIASQMKPMVVEETTVTVKADQYTLEAKGSIVVEPGFSKVYEVNRKEVTLPQVAKGDTVSLDNIEVSEKETEPPSRYSEATLVKELEAKGVGRPSTYASIIDTLLRRAYVERSKKALVPTDLGISVFDALSSSLGDFVATTFTAEMEEGLDKIASSKETKVSLLTPFWSKLNKALEGLRNGPVHPRGAFNSVPATRGTNVGKTSRKTGSARRKTGGGSRTRVSSGVRARRSAGGSR